MLASSALHLGACDLDAIRLAAAPRRKGPPALRHALTLADPRPESAWEVVSLMLHRVLGVAVTPQAEIRSADGTFVARADLLVDGTTDLHEYDGAQHREPGEHRRDLDRDRRIVNAGHVRRGYTSEVLVHRPVVVLRDCEVALGHSIERDRLREWYALLAASLFTEAGTRTVVRRIGEGAPSRRPAAGPREQLVLIGGSRQAGSAG